jgi:hypothetical protein
MVVIVVAVVVVVVVVTVLFVMRGKYFIAKTLISKPFTGHMPGCMNSKNDKI